MSFNKLFLSSIVAKDPRFFNAGTGFGASFSAPSNSRQKQKDGTWADVTTWLEVTVFGSNEDWLRKNYFKGAKFSVAGELVEEKWTDRDGNTRSTLRVTADRNAAEGHTKLEDQNEPRQERPTQTQQSSGGAPYNDDIPFMKVMGPW